MRLLTFSSHGRTRLGCAVDNEVVDLNLACEAMLIQQGKLRAKQIAEAFVPANMVEFLQGEEESMQLAQESVSFILNNRNMGNFTHILHSLHTVKLLAPVLHPGKMICVGHNYREHILEMKREIPQNPVIFAKFANTIIGPQDEIPLFPLTQKLDYEAEFAFVIGKRAKNVTREHALDYVAGYTIVNDISARDLQMRTVQWLQGKTVDGSAPMGPWLVTKEELENPHELEICLSVNGEERQRSNTKNLVFDVNYLVEFLSEIMTLEPGDVILTGTPGGVGVASDPPCFLQDGDVIRIEVSQIGVLENRVKKV